MKEGRWWGTWGLAEQEAGTTPRDEGTRHGQSPATWEQGESLAIGAVGVERGSYSKEVSEKAPVLSLPPPSLGQSEASHDGAHRGPSERHRVGQEDFQSIKLLYLYLSVGVIWFLILTSIYFQGY